MVTILCPSCWFDQTVLNLSPPSVQRSQAIAVKPSRPSPCTSAIIIDQYCNTSKAAHLSGSSHEAWSRSDAWNGTQLSPRWLQIGRRHNDCAYLRARDWISLLASDSESVIIGYQTNGRNQADYNLMPPHYVHKQAEPRYQASCTSYVNGYLVNHRTTEPLDLSDWPPPSNSLTSGQLASLGNISSNSLTPQKSCGRTVMRAEAGWALDLHAMLWW